MSKTPKPAPIGGLPRRPPTAHDVARLAGVSQSAVSRAFTDGASVSGDMRQRVAEAAEQLGYRPNLIARSLITRRSNIVGVVAGYLQNQFYPEMLEALSERLGSMGYRLLLFPGDPKGVSDPMLDEILRFRVEALVLASATLSSRLADECRKAGVPMVLVNRTIDDAAVSSVTGDNLVGGSTVAAFLAAGGHRRFAYVSGLENSSTSRDRETGFAAYLNAQGLGPHRKAAGHYAFKGAVEAARTLFSAPELPDAVFCANDHMAMAVVETARSEFGLTIGRDVSIVGFDNVGAADWPSFRLTTYAQPILAMVDQVAAILQDILADPSAPARQERTPGQLVVRDSARLPSRGVTEQDGIRTWSAP